MGNLPIISPESFHVVQDLTSSVLVTTIYLYILHLLLALALVYKHAQVYSIKTHYTYTLKLF